MSRARSRSRCITGARVAHHHHERTSLLANAWQSEGEAALFADDPTADATLPPAMLATVSEPEPPPPQPLDMAAPLKQRSQSFPRSACKAPRERGPSKEKSVGFSLAAAPQTIEERLKLEHSPQQLPYEYDGSARDLVI